MVGAAVCRLEDLQRREAVLVAELGEAQERVKVLLAEVEEALKKEKVLARNLLDVRTRSRILARNIEKGVSVKSMTKGGIVGNNVSGGKFRGLYEAVRAPGDSVEENDFLGDRAVKDVTNVEVIEIGVGGEDTAKGDLGNGDMVEVDLDFEPPAEVARGAVERLVLTLPLPHTTFRHPCLW